MKRWRLILVFSMSIALILWISVLFWNLRAEAIKSFAHSGAGSPVPGQFLFDESLSHLPAWVSSLSLLLTLFMLGVVNLYLFPVRIRNMQRALTSGWSNLLRAIVLGLATLLVMLGSGLSAALARLTFPLTVFLALTVFLLTVWGFLGLSYAAGRALLKRAGWLTSSPIAAQGLGLLLLLPWARIPFIGGLFALLFLSLGLGLVIATRFGSTEPWNLTPLLED